MKRLHKKIGVGVLVAGLLVGGISFSSGSVSHASSSIGESSLLPDIIDVSSELGIKLSPELEAFLKGGHKGVLDYYGESLLENIFNQEEDGEVRDVVGSIFGFSQSSNYSVMGAKVKGKQYSISDYSKYWDSKHSKLKKISFNAFLEAVRKGNLNKLGLSGGDIYRVRFDGEYEFLIVVF